MIEFHVPGVPVPQGSTKHIGNGRVIAANPKQKQWRQDVATVASFHKPSTPWTLPVSVSYLFVFEAPKSRAKTPFKQAGWQPHTVTPDLDKLIRCVNDGLSASVKKAAPIMEDDGLVWDITSKCIEIPNKAWNSRDYPTVGYEPGVYVKIVQTELGFLAPVSDKELVAA